MEFLTKLGYGGTITLIGIGMVFVGLIILIVFISLMSRLLNSKKEAPKAAAPAPAPVVVPEPVAEVAAAETGAQADELIAVITAALMAYTASEKGSATAGKTLVVRNIRAAAAKQSAWGRAGRVDQLNSRF